MKENTGERILSFIGIFIALVILFSSVYALTFVANDAASFGEGTYNKTFFNTSSATLQLVENDTEQELPENGANDGFVNMYGNVLYYHMNEAGGSIFDYSGTGNTGTPTGNVFFSQPGKINTGLQFDGSSSTYISVGNNPTVDFDDDDYSILLWVKNNNYTPDGWEDSYVNKAIYPNQGRRGYSVSIRGSLDQFGNAGKGYGYSCLSTSTCDDYGIYTTKLINDSTWHHLAFTVDRQGNATLYLDGILQGSKDISPRASYNESNNIPLLIGARSDPTSTTNGTLDEVMIWRRALTPEEVWNYYAHGPV